MSWRIGEILVKEKWITWDQLEEALAEQARTKELIGTILIRRGFVYPSVVHRALAKQNHMTFVDLKRTVISPEAVEKVPHSIAVKYCLIPLEFYENVLTLGVPSPTHIWPKDEIKGLSEVDEIKTVLCLESEIREAQKEAYKGSGADPDML